jgi:hypothetical protein
LDSAVFYGNCQAAALGQILGDHEPFTSRFNIEPVVPVHELRPGDHEHVVAAAAQAKLLVHQPVGQQFSPASTLELMAGLSPTALSVCFPVLWFDGYCPDAQYLKIAGAIVRGGPSDYHSGMLIEGYLRGWSPEQVAALYDDLNVLDADGLRAAAGDAVERLRERERWSPAVNVRVADFVKSRFADERLFHTFNHPSATMLFFLADEILDRLDLPRLGQETKTKHQAALSRPRIPELAAVHTALGLSFERYREFWVRSGEHLNRADGAARYFEFYRQIGLEEKVSLADLGRRLLRP